MDKGFRGLWFTIYCRNGAQCNSVFISDLPRDLVANLLGYFTRSQGEGEKNGSQLDGKRFVT